jgi:hypothetical protein
MQSKEIDEGGRGYAKNAYEGQRLLSSMHFHIF